VTEQPLYQADELFRQIAAGDEAAFSKAFYYYNKRIYPYFLNKVQSEGVAKEMVQDVFLKLWISREKLLTSANPEGYLFLIAANLLKDYFRRMGREQKMRAFWSKKEEGQVVESEVWYSETRKLLDAAMHQLPPERQRIYQMRMDGHSYETIADMLQISVNTVRNQLVSATKAVRAYLKDQGLAGLILVILWKGF
jgi:RNA polymerase sigma factor (sigma-70 family)